MLARVVLSLFGNDFVGSLRGVSFVPVSPFLVFEEIKSQPSFRDGFSNPPSLWVWRIGLLLVECLAQFIFPKYSRLPRFPGVREQRQFANLFGDCI